MKKRRNNQEREKLYQKLVEIDDLLQEIEEVEQEEEARRKAHPELIPEWKRETEQGFESLMARIKTENRKPVDSGMEQWRKEGKRGCGRKRHKKIAVVAALIGGLVAGGGIRSIARNGYQYMMYPEKRKENIGVRYNTNIEYTYDGLDSAYSQISENLEIPVLTMDYIPNGMEFQGIRKTENYVLIQFVYHDNYFYFKQERLLEKDAIGMVVSDRNNCQNIWNDWLDRNLQLEENELENEIIEYSMALEGDEAYYYLCGIMEKEEFVKILENLMYY